MIHQTQQQGAMESAALDFVNHSTFSQAPQWQSWQAASCQLRIYCAEHRPALPLVGQRRLGRC